MCVEITVYNDAAQKDTDHGAIDGEKGSNNNA